VKIRILLPKINFNCRSKNFQPQYCSLFDGPTILTDEAKAKPSLPGFEIATPLDRGITILVYLYLNIFKTKTKKAF
jgi:hypothetical protein